jgi:hypothetical protein
MPEETQTTTNPQQPAPALKARVKVVIEEMRQTNNGPQLFEPTVYEQTLPADKLDLQAVIAAANKELKPKSAT